MSARAEAGCKHHLSSKLHVSPATQYMLTGAPKGTHSHCRQLHQHRQRVYIQVQGTADMHDTERERLPTSNCQLFAASYCSQCPCRTYPW